MGLLSRISKAFTHVPFLNSAISPFEGSSMLHAKPRPFNYDIATRNFHSWMHSALNLRAKTASNVPLRLYLRDKKNYTKLFETRQLKHFNKSFLMGDTGVLPSKGVLRKTAQWGGDFEEITEKHPVLECLTKPNVSHSGFDLTMYRFLNLYITGNAYLHPIIDQSLGIPTEIWNMPSMWCEIIPDRDNYLKGYAFGQYQVNATFFKPEEVIHFKLPNPRDMFYGMGLIEAAWSTVGLENAKAEMDLAFVDNMGRPDWIMVVKNANGNDQNLKRYSQEVEKELRGRSKRGRMITVGGEVDFKELNKVPEVYGDSNPVIEKLLAVLGVPIQLLKGNETTLANSRAGYLSFLTNTIVPDLRADEEVLNQRFLPLFGEEVADNCFLAYDSAVPQDRAMELKEHSIYVRDRILVPNEVRRRLGLPDIEGGDVLQEFGRSGSSGGGGGHRVNNDGADGSAADDANADATIE